MDKDKLRYVMLKEIEKNDNIVLGDGNIVLSQKGAQLLLEEIEKRQLDN